jgi:predicted site-specific integrase-resolvase
MDTTTLTEREAAPRLGVSPHTLRTWRRLGRGPRYLKLGKAVRYRPEDVEAYKAAMQIDPMNTGASSELTPQ